MKTKLIQGDYKEFNGRYNEQMPLLVNEGLQPLTAKDVIQYRLQAIQSKDKIDFWSSRYFDTVTGLAYHNGELVVIPNSQDLLNITQDFKLNSGSLILSSEQYKGLVKQHRIIKRKNIISGRDLTKKEAKNHPIWIKLAQGDKALLNEYTDAIFAETKTRYNYDENMGIYLPDDQEQPALRDWFLRYLGNRSRANAGGGLGGDSRLLGVCVRNLEQVLGKVAFNGKLVNPSELEKAIQFYKSGKSGKLDLSLLR